MSRVRVTFVMPALCAGEHQADAGLLSLSVFSRSEFRVWFWRCDPGPAFTCSLFPVSLSGPGREVSSDHEPWHHQPVSIPAPGPLRCSQGEASWLPVWSPGQKCHVEVRLVTSTSSPQSLFFRDQKFNIHGPGDMTNDMCTLSYPCIFPSNKHPVMGLITSAHNT